MEGVKVECEIKTENAEELPAEEVSPITVNTELIVEKPTESIQQSEVVTSENKGNYEDNECAADKVEDVPADFFDDFNNKDFLAGLDVVDAWEGEEEEDHKLPQNDDSSIPKTSVVEIVIKSENILEVEKVIDSEKVSASENNGKSDVADNEEYVSSVSKETSTRSSDALSDKSTISGDGCIKVVKYTIPKKRRSRSRSREKEKERGRVLQTSGGKNPDESRRDPDKVRRDIQRDKAKCEKQRITEKLRMVETGLVPPGTEMDVPDAREAKRTHEKGEAAKRTHEKGEELCAARRSNEASNKPRAAKRPYSRSPSPAYRRKKRYSRSRSPPPVHISAPRRRYSPPSSTYRRRTRSRSRSRSPGRRTMRNRSRSVSPLRRKDRLPSKRSRDRDRSTERKTSFLDELERKLSRTERTHMQKLTAKINGESLLSTPHMHALPSSGHAMQAQHHNMMHGMVAQGMGMHAPAPQMVPAPMVYETAYQDASYDQSFFVGNSAYSNMSYPTHAQPHIAHASFQHSDVAAMQQTFTSYEMTLEADRKLFEDDSILLSEYLKLSQHAGNTQGFDASQKLKVLNRCQDALKLMSELQHPNGRFYYHVSTSPTRKSKWEPLGRRTSPMRCRSPVCFGFTTKCADEKQPTALSRLLARMDIREKIIPKSPENSKNAKSTPTRTEAETQTADFECNTCVIRKQVKHVDVGVQCTPETFEFSAQVTEDDFLRTARSALKGMLKQQSFASLTPAQILAQLAEDKELENGGARSDHEEGGRDSSGGYAPQQYERRENRDFDRRNEWNARPYQQQSPQKDSQNFTPMYNNINPRYPTNSGMRPRGCPIRSLMDLGPRGQSGPGYRQGPPYDYQNPSNYGNMRRF